MHEHVIILYTKAKKDLVFRQQLKDSGEKRYKPGLFWDKMDKALYATVYWGWLVARGVTEYEALNN